MHKSLFTKFLLIFLVHINASAIEKVVLFGDSLMAGYGLPKEHHLSLVLENNLKQDGFNIQVINGSVSGSTSSGGLNRAEWSLSDPGIDLIILGMGANDMLRGIQPDETKKNLEQIIEIAKKKEIEIVLAGMIAPTTHGIKYKKDFDDIYPKLSKKYNLQFIPFLLEGVALNPSLNQQDGIHPNKQGTIKISENIKKSIMGILDKKKN
ncbi:arylesterase [Candidatus Pelagibacter sp.]|nr:arylesterase [Candidatus Pelagibacter sp.]